MCHKYKLQVSCFGFLSSSLNVVWLLHTLKDYAQYDLCDAGLYSSETISMFFEGQVSGLVENSNNGIYSDTTNVINVKLCMMVLLTELYLFIPLSVALTISQGHGNVEQF